MALRDAVKTPAGARLFATELYAFLYGHGSPQRRFNDWIEALRDLPQRQSKVLTWPVATVFGFIARPDRHLFFKPRAMRKAAHAYGYALQYQASPSWAQVPPPAARLRSPAPSLPAARTPHRRGSG